MKSLQGQFLVASPHLADPNFYRSVVLMIKHDDEGAFGLVLNRPTDSTIREIWKVVAEEEIDCPRPIFWGGPVNGPLVALHRVKSAAEADVLPGVHFAANKKKLHRILSQTTKPYRFFTGYAGWAGGQLDGELHAGGWLSAKVKKNLIFYEGDDLWDQLVKTIGEGVLGDALKTKHVPDNPSLN